MRTKKILIIKLVFIMLLILPNCIRDKEAVTEPKQDTIEKPEPFYDPVLAADTNRVWTNLHGDTLFIYPKALYVQFIPSVGVKDSSQIKLLLAKHNLRAAPDKMGVIYSNKMFLCITDNRRAEYHFTLYVREDLHNFGADSLVEYCFGVFDNGYGAPNGELIIEFVENTPEMKIDSLFTANGLRVVKFHGFHYLAFTTRDVPTNVIDFGLYLKKIPFVQNIWLDFQFPEYITGYYSKICERLNDSFNLKQFKISYHIKKRVVCKNDCLYL